MTRIPASHIAQAELTLAACEANPGAYPLLERMARRLLDAAATQPAEARWLAWTKATNDIKELSR